MKYIIQIVRTVDPSEGYFTDPEMAKHYGVWTNTAWGGDDLDKVMETAHKIIASNKMNIGRVRVVENLFEMDCK